MLQLLDNCSTEFQKSALETAKNSKDLLADANNIKIHVKVSKRVLVYWVKWTREIPIHRRSLSVLNPLPLPAVALEDRRQYLDQNRDRDLVPIPAR